MEQTTGVYDTACLDIFLRTGVFHLLSNAPDIKSGVHIHQLQQVLNIDAVKIAVILRFLAAQGWVYETTEGTFAITRPSLELLEEHGGYKWAMYATAFLISAS